jgi:hypothetical protein
MQAVLGRINGAKEDKFKADPKEKDGNKKRRRPPAR